MRSLGAVLACAALFGTTGADDIFSSEGTVDLGAWDVDADAPIFIMDEPSPCHRQQALMDDLGAVVDDIIKSMMSMQQFFFDAEEFGTHPCGRELALTGCNDELCLTQYPEVLGDICAAMLLQHRGDDPFARGFASGPLIMVTQVDLVEIEEEDPDMPTFESKGIQVELLDVSSHAARASPDMAMMADDDMRDFRASFMPRRPDHGPCFGGVLVFLLAAVAFARLCCARRSRSAEEDTHVTTFEPLTIVEAGAAHKVAPHYAAPAPPAPQPIDDIKML